MQGGKGLGGHPVPLLPSSRRLYGVSVAWVKAGRAHGPGGERGIPGLGCGKGGKTAVSRSFSPFRVPGLGTGC